MPRLETQESFAEEIKFSELEFEKVVGRGAFGVVSKAKWKGCDVAVKMIDSEAEIKAFLVELRQLSRVEHENIVCLYGACRDPVCLVMEYAEGGSLYNVLHAPSPQPEYTASHAMSWAFQCAKGVAYLHGMKPKALIHRDLKPANLLLIAGGTVLKICDFGTACDLQTYMTNNKGSAAWMAPEVFEGSLYSDRCDVFSWSIILWEVITRRKPFSEIGGPAFRIMWAVHQGTRPPLIRNLPKPIEKLMTRCWSNNPTQRPSMTEVSGIMSRLMKYFKGADVPLVYSQVVKDKNSSERNETEDGADDDEDEEEEDESQMTSGSQLPGSRASTLSDTVINQQTGPGVASPMFMTQPTPQPSTAVLIREQFSNIHLSEASLKRRSTDFAELRIGSEERKPTKGHRRSNSHGQTYTHPLSSTNQSLLPWQLTMATPAVNIQPSTPIPFPPILPHSHTVPSNLTAFDFNKPRSSSDLLNQTDRFVDENILRSGSTNNLFAPLQPAPSNASSTTSRSSKMDRTTRSISLDNQGLRTQTVPDESVPMYVTLDSRLQPLPPNPKSKDSLEVFEQHCQIAKDFLRVQTEIALLHQRKKDLAGQLDQNFKQKQTSFQYYEDFTHVKTVSEELRCRHKALKMQLDSIRGQQRTALHPPS